MKFPKENEIKKIRNTDYYNIFADIYDYFDDKDSNVSKRWILFLEKAIKRNKVTGNKVLDVGAGTGKIAIPLAKEGYEVTALDLSKRMLAKLKEKAGDIKIGYKVSDIVNFNIDKRFDVVVMLGNSVNETKNDEKVYKIFKKVRSLLNPGGIFVFDLHCYLTRKKYFFNFWTKCGDSYLLTNQYLSKKYSVLGEKIVLKLKSGLYKVSEVKFHQRRISKSTIKKLLKRAKFKDINLYQNKKLNYKEEEAKNRAFFVCK